MSIFPEPKNSELWFPTAFKERLVQRAQIIAKIRCFFETRGVLEVETPLISAGSANDVYLHPIRTLHQTGQTLYLQTSPEFAMKRLLAAGYGPIYQICKAFRDEESGSRHNPEFTMLEWYRPGFDHHQLMAEVNALLSLILESKETEYFSYQALFQEFLAIDPWRASIDDLQSHATAHQIRLEEDAETLTRDDWLDILLTHLIEPKLKEREIVFIYDYPPSQAALARIWLGTPNAPPVAERFEVYYQGMELANGYHESLDADEQLARLTEANHRRQQLNLPLIPEDQRLVAALEAGMPPCAGVAIGVDRLVMLKVRASHISEVLAFPFDRA